MGHITAWTQLKVNHEDMEEMIEKLRNVEDGLINSNSHLMKVQKVKRQKRRKSRVMRI